MIYREPLYIMILKSDGEIQIKALEDTDEPTQEMLQEIVGGDIQAIPATYGILIGNKEAKLYPLPFNRNATALMRHSLYEKWDEMSGDVALVLQDGERMTGLPFRRATRIADSLREAAMPA